MMDHAIVLKELAKTKCDWIEFKMNMPNASHMSGMWERQIRTVRSVLSPFIRQPWKSVG